MLVAIHYYPQMLPGALQLHVTTVYSRWHSINPLQPLRCQIPGQAYDTAEYLDFTYASRDL